MTTRITGRPAATTPARTGRVFLLATLVLALFAPATVALAAPIDDDAPFRTRADSATQADAPAVAKPASDKPAADKPATPSLTARALSFAQDMQRVVSPMTMGPLAQDNPTQALGQAIDAQGDGKVKSVLQKALTLLGTPYRWGGTEPDKGFDCSGLVGYVFRNALGIELPRVSRDMAKNGELITDRAKLAAGDLVFFGLKGRVNHVGIYVGDGQFVHAPSRGKDVTVSSLEKGYWSGRFLQARRVNASGG